MCRSFWISQSEISSSLLGEDCPGTGTSPSLPSCAAGYCIQSTGLG